MLSRRSNFHLIQTCFCFLSQGFLTLARMSSRVTPRGQIKETPPQISVQPATNHGSLVELSQTEENVNEALLLAIESTYNPVFKVMKLLGMYYGDTTFGHLAHSSARRTKHNYTHGFYYAQCFYCGLVVAGLWFNFVMPLVSILYGGDFFLLIMFVSWCVLVALNATTCLILLSFTNARKSRFRSFLRKAIAIQTDAVNLETVKSKARVYLILFCILFLVAVTGAFLTTLALNISLGNFEPWNVWFGFRITSMVFLVFGCGVWLLSFPFFCITCLILEALFDDLHKRMASLHSRPMTVATLRREHQKLCKVVESADGVLSPLVFEAVAFFIPVICFNFYQAVVTFKREELTFVFLIADLLWLLTSAALLAITMLFGSRVHEKVKLTNQETNIQW